MQLHTCLFTQSDCYAAGKSMIPQGVMVHSTGADNPSLKRYLQPDDGLLGCNSYDNHWNRPGLDVCVHAFIGKLKGGSVATYQTLPWEMRAWHCGRSGNDTHLSFEICEDGLNDGAYFHAVYQEAVELTAHLCRTFGLDPLADGVVLDHAEGYARGIASNHRDVGHWFSRHGRTMDGFREDVAWELARPEAPEAPAGDRFTRQELERLIQAAVEADRRARTCRTLEEVPGWARSTVQRLAGSGVLLGDGSGLNLSYDLLRALVVLDRLGKL